MALLPGLGALLLAAAPAEEIRERAAGVLRERGYQTELPSAPVPKEFHLPLGPFELLLRLLLWTALAVAVVLAVTWLVRRLRRAPGDVEIADEGAEGGPVAIPIASAEALAARGLWAEAIHVLLLETVDALSRAARLAPSLTSREIAARVPLPSRAREALSGLVLAVEVSRFGGAAAGEADYRACLDRFRAFLDTYRSAA